MRGSARRLRLPVVYLVDCSGLYLPEQAHSFPGRTGAGHIFKKNALKRVVLGEDEGTLVHV